MDSSHKMHADEANIDASLVQRLVRSQFPEWSDLEIQVVESSGSSNAMYRLGDELVARLPRIPSAAGAVSKEQRWLPILGPHLPIAVPEPVGSGRPAEKYPYEWSIFKWLTGETLTLGSIDDPLRLAHDIANFIIALRAVETPSAPVDDGLLSYRGGPLLARDVETRAAISDCADLVNGELATKMWDDALKIPAWDGNPVWIHGDIMGLNLLAEDGRLSAVIDFGGLAVGDPAVDQIVAWNLLPPNARKVFRDALAPDEATWQRGRAWALSIGLVALPYYRQSNPALADSSLRAIQEALADYVA